MPGHHECKCGRLWNGYVIGTGGSNHEAAAEKYLVREIMVRPDVIVASRQAATSEELNAERQKWRQRRQEDFAQPHNQIDMAPIWEQMERHNNPNWAVRDAAGDHEATEDDWPTEHHPKTPNKEHKVPGDWAYRSPKGRYGPHPMPRRPSPQTQPAQL